MKRFALEHLAHWKSKPNRKPLLIRGARQVGKSYLVREFARVSQLRCIELNFEKTPQLAELFQSRDPRKIVELLQVQCNCDIIPGTTLLFLDEIQAAPALIALLRYFYEEMPALHVIAAGSLLEFVLAQPAFSIPVGRVEYLYLGPMQFEEFIVGLGEEKLHEFLCNYHLPEPIPQPLHERLLELAKRYCLVGGMPEAVAIYQQTGLLRSVDEVQRNMVSAYTDDFAKYQPRIHYDRMTKIFQRVPLIIGEKVKYTRIDPHERSKDVAEGLMLLGMARILHRVCVSHCNGVPLGGEVNEKFFKLLFLDVGLVSQACGLTVLDYETRDDLQLVNQGRISEQFVGQHLLDQRPLYAPPELYYWAREQRSASAEVDYVMAVGSTLVPVEVKSGKTGSLKSLQLFLREKKRHLAVRLSSQPPSVTRTRTTLPGNGNIPFTLVSLPFYLVGQLQRLLATPALR